MRSEAVLRDATSIRMNERCNKEVRTMKQEEGMKELKERIMQMLNLQISIQSTIIEIRIKKE